MPDFEAVTSWWQRKQGGGENSSPRMWAELRRAEKPIDALLVEGTLELIPVMGLRAELIARYGREADQLGTLAATLAHVKTQIYTSTAQAWANQQPPLSGDRLQMLLRTQGWSDRMRELRNCLAIVRGVANISDLAKLVWYWDKQRLSWFLQFNDGLIQHGE